MESKTSGFKDYRLKPPCRRVDTKENENLAILEVPLCVLVGIGYFEVLMEAYSFTSRDIASAILKAHKRGVHVEIILDKSNRSARYSSGDFTAHMGIPTYINTAYAIAHNKIMIIDREIVITGSFNFTKAAEEKHAENPLILRNKDLAGIYLGNWENHRDRSEKIHEYEQIKRGNY